MNKLKTNILIFQSSSEIIVFTETWIQEGPLNSKLGLILEFMNEIELFFIRL